MRQRLGVARCLLADPALLILDEPMNGLDPAGILEFRGLVRDLVDEGRTVFLSSHLLDEVERTATWSRSSTGVVSSAGPHRRVAGGDGASLAIECDDPAAALALLAARRDVARVTDGGAELRVALVPGADAIELTRALVLAGIGLRRVEPARVSLEQRFLELTSSLGGEP